MELEIKALSSLLGSDMSRTYVSKRLRYFRCSRDKDVESFLHRYAIRNETTGATRTYLAVDAAALSHGELAVVAFFSLAITAADYSAFGAEERREVLGPVPRLSTATHFPGYLLAQLARDDRYTHADCDCMQLVVRAERMLARANAIAGGGLVYLDCREGLVGYYAAQGYEPLAYDPATGLHKLFKPIAA